MWNVKELLQNRETERKQGVIYSLLHASGNTFKAWKNDSDCIWDTSACSQLNLLLNKVESRTQICTLTQIVQYMIQSVLSQYCTASV